MDRRLACILILFVVPEILPDDTIEFRGKIITGDDPDDLASVLDYISSLLQNFYSIEEKEIEDTMKIMIPLPANDYLIADRLLKVVSSLLNLLSNETALENDFGNETSDKIDHTAKLLNTVQDILKYFQDEQLDEVDNFIIPDGDITEYVIKSVEEIMKSFYEETNDSESNPVSFPKESLMDDLRRLTSTTNELTSSLATTKKPSVVPTKSVTTLTNKPGITTKKQENPGKSLVTQQTRLTIFIISTLRTTPTPNRNIFTTTKSKITLKPILITTTKGAIVQTTTLKITPKVTVKITTMSTTLKTTTTTTTKKLTKPKSGDDGEEEEEEDR